MSKGGKIAVILLFILVFLSLALNGFLLWQLYQARQQGLRLAQAVRQGLPQAISGVEAFEKSTLQFKVQVKQDFPVQADIPFEVALDVPVQLTVPISQEIKTTVMVDPFNSGLSVPIDVAVPIDLELPIDTTVPISVAQTIPISTTIPLALDVPIAIKVSETELAGYLEQLRSGLTALNEILSQMEP